jgi:hypothetical protein
MSDEDRTHFQFEFRGVKVEISGTRDYVDSMYQILMRDMEAARRGAIEDLEPVETHTEERLLWVHRCSEMMHKIYMTAPHTIRNSALGRAMNANAVDTLYAEKHAFDDLLSSFAGDRTLWAELTAEGRKTIDKADAKKNTG